MPDPSVEDLVAKGSTLHRAGRVAEASQLYREALDRDPRHARALHHLGVTLHQQGRHAEGIASIERAVEVEPTVGEFWLNLSLVRRAAGDAAGAVAAATESVRLEPLRAEAHHALARALIDAGRIDEAAECFERAYAIRPDPQACLSAGLLLRKWGRIGPAARLLRRAAELSPQWPEAWAQLGIALQLCRRLGAAADDATACLARAVTLDPKHAVAHHYLSLDLRDAGDVRGQVAHLSAAAATDPSGWSAVEAATALPLFYHSVAEIDAWRDRFATEVDRLATAGVRVDLTNRPAALTFPLAYHGRNDRDLLARLPSLYHVPQPALAPRAGRGGRIRIGFLSRFLRDHTIGRLNRQLITRLSRDAFEVVVVAADHCDDEVTRALGAAVDEYVELPQDIAAARDGMAQLGLEALIYTDVGMDPMTSTLALSRLAPVQCATWGHPDTTGSPVIDYFLSSAAMEVPEADSHYTERLVRLDHLAVCYDRPELAGDLSDRPSLRRAFPSLPPDVHWYGCPQSLFKIHPEFDGLLGEILRRDPAGHLVLLAGQHVNWERMLRHRLTSTIGAAAVDRVHFLPRLDRTGFLRLSAACDVLLDPIHFGGGNTTFEALAVGTPVVTLPSRFLRGRIALAIYDQIGWRDCVVASPEQYVALAVQIGTDGHTREAMRREIVSRHDRLFDQVAGVRDVEAFLLRVVRGLAT